MKAAACFNVKDQKWKAEQCESGREGASMEEMYSMSSTVDEGYSVWATELYLWFVTVTVWQLAEVLLHGGSKQIPEN